MPGRCPILILTSESLSTLGHHDAQAVCEWRGQRAVGEWGSARIWASLGASGALKGRAPYHQAAVRQTGPQRGCADNLLRPAILAPSQAALRGARPASGRAARVVVRAEPGTSLSKVSSQPGPQRVRSRAGDRDPGPSRPPRAPSRPATVAGGDVADQPDNGQGADRARRLGGPARAPTLARRCHRRCCCGRSPQASPAPRSRRRPSRASLEQCPLWPAGSWHAVPGRSGAAGAAATASRQDQHWCAAPTLQQRHPQLTPPSPSPTQVDRSKDQLFFASEASLTYLDGSLPGDFGFVSARQ